jgi:RNA polymerase sigma factor (sigma-70 family)
MTALAYELCPTAILAGFAALTAAMASSVLPPPTVRQLMKWPLQKESPDVPPGSVTVNKEKFFLQTLEEHKKLIFKISWSYTDNAEDAKDLRQEIFRQLWESFDSFRGESKISTWMYRVAIRTANLQLRARKKRKTESLDEIPEAASAYEPRDEGFDDKSLRLLSRFDKSEKDIVMLRMEGLPIKEIADVLGMTEAAIHNRILRMKEKYKL